MSENDSNEEITGLLDLDENETGHDDAFIGQLEALAYGRDTLVHEETTGTRRSYACERQIIRRPDGSLWALEYNANEVHSYATDAYEVEAKEVTTVKYVRKVASS